MYVCMYMYIHIHVYIYIHIFIRFLIVLCVSQAQMRTVLDSVALQKKNSQQAIEAN